MLLDESERPKSLRKDGQRRIISDRRKERAAEKPEGSETDVGSQHPASGPGLSQSHDHETAGPFSLEAY